MVFGKSQTKKKGRRRNSSEVGLNFGMFITDKDFINHKSLDQVAVCHPFEPPSNITLPRTGHRCLKVIHSLFKMVDLKYKVMNEIKESDGLLLSEFFKFENTGNKLLFWKRLYFGILHAILPFSKHGINKI